MLIKFPTNCPTHYILNQTWSKGEARFLVENKDIMSLCGSCFCHFLEMLETEQMGVDLAEIERQLQEQGKKETLGDA